MAALPKLDMNSVKEKDEKEKKTLKESMRKLSRKASASLKRGLTPRGSRHEQKDSYDSLDEGEEDALAGALGPQSSTTSFSGSDSLAGAAPQPAPAETAPSQPLMPPPPLVEAPRPEQELLPQFEPAEAVFAAAKDFGKDRKPQADAPAELGEMMPAALPGESMPPSGGGLPTAQQTLKAASADVSLHQPSLGKAAELLQSFPAPAVSVDPNSANKADASSDQPSEAGNEAGSGLGKPVAPTADTAGNGDEEGDPAPRVQAPPGDRPAMPQFEDASANPAVKAAHASAEDQVPAAAAAVLPQPDAEGEATAMVQDPLSPARRSRPKWQEIGLTLSVFALGIVAAEPALAAWRRHRQPTTQPVVQVENAKRRGGWGFA